jgi:signal transduction histidine kinase
MANKTFVEKEDPNTAQVYSGYALLNEKLDIVQYSPMIAKWLKLKNIPYCLESYNPALHTFIESLVGNAKLDLNGWSHDEFLLNNKRFDCAINITNSGSNAGSVHLFLSDHVNSRLEKTFLELAELDANIGGWELIIPSQELIWSKNLYLIYGLAKATQINHALSKGFFSAESLQRYEECIEACKLGTAFIAIFDCVNAMGQAKKIRISGKPIFNAAGEVSKLRGTVQDVTEDWYDSARYNLAIETAGIGVFEFDHITSELIWNKHMYALYNKPADQPISYSQWHDSVHPEDMDIAKTAFISSIKKGHPFSNIFRVVHKNGDVKYIKASAKTFVDQDKKPLKSIGVNIDITTLIEQEDQLALQRSVALYNAKLAAVGEMAASIGHEINNPLAIAIGNIELLKEIIHRQPPPATQLLSHFTAIDSSLQRIQSIVGGMKYLAKDESKEDKLDVNINELLRITVTLFQQIYKKQGININYTPNINIQDVVVNGHFGELQQVLMNIINNARDAVLDSHVKDIRVSAGIDNRQIMIQITDSGIGIKKELHSRIFESFFSTKKPTNATGLGLAAVRRILTDHKGKIEVESEPGKGASFKVYIPLKGDVKNNQSNEGLATSPIVKPSSVAPNFDHISVIVIDDEPMLLEIIAAQLKSFGMTVLTTNSPATVLDEVKTGNYHLLITDMCMPLCDGLNLISQVKAIQTTKMSYILMTGGITEDLSKDSDSVYQQLDGILYKPFNRQALLKMLNGLNLKVENDNVR